MNESGQTPAAPSREGADHLGVGWVILAIGGGGVVGMATIVGDIVSAGFLLFILLMGVRGHRLGAMKISAGVLGLLAAIRWAPTLSPYLAKAPKLANVTAQWNEFPEPLQKLSCLIGAGVLIGVVVMVMIRVLAHKFFRSKPCWKWADRWIGATLGGAEGIVLSAILLFAALMLEPIARRQLETRGRDEVERFSSTWNKSVLVLTKSVRGSSVGKILESLEPLRSRFDMQMRSMTSAATEGNEPGGSFQSKVMRMIDQFRHDSVARSILSSKTNLDDATLRKLLDSQEFSETLNDVMPNHE